MSTEILIATETVANNEINPTNNNEQTDASATNGVSHSNGTKQLEQQQVESTRNAYDSNDLEPESLRKVFIGGLSYKTDDQVFKDFFSKYGDIVVSIVALTHTNENDLIYLGLYYNA